MSARPRPRPSLQADPSAGPLAPAARLRGGSDGSAQEIVERAEALNIPWQRLLLDEIQVEQTLRRHVLDACEDVPLATALSVLPSSFLKSWRVRDQIQSLSCEARGASFRKAVRELRLVFHRLIGQPGGGQAAFSGHLWLAYHRVLLLQRVCRAARRSRGSNAERLAFTCSRTRCSFEDAAWAICHEDSPRPGHRLDAAIHKAREEGFVIPRASSEARSFAKLRRIVRASPDARPRRPPASLPRDLVSLPARLMLPTDSI